MSAEPEVKRIAGFLGAEDADQPVFDALLANEAFGPLVLFEGTGAIQIGAAAFLREALGVVDQCLGELGAENLDEMRAPDPKDVVDKPFEFLGRRHGQMPFEDHPIEAMQGANNDAGKLGHEGPYCVHGILPRLAVLNTNHPGG